MELWRSPFRLLLTFFGLTSSDRDNIYSEIHEIVFNGNGGYNWEDVYNMPIRLRKFIFKKLQTYYNKQSEIIEHRNLPQDSKVNKVLKPNIIAPPTPLSPSTYSTNFSSKK